MIDLPFYIVDVFATDQKYTGNQLAVFLCADQLSLAEMQQIAREINFSESTFVTSIPETGAYPVKIFTPAMELPFAGHPTLGTAWVIQRIYASAATTITLQYSAGQVPVKSNGDPSDLGQVLWMTQRSPEFLGQLEAFQLATVLQIDPEDIDDRYPIEQVSTGLPFIIVPLKTLAAVQQAQLKLDAYYQLIANISAQSILIFCPETLNSDNHLHARVFTHALGIPEDPATGSANGCLAAYLVQHQYQDQLAIDWRVEQGYEIDRPSLLYLRAQPGQVEVGGQVMLVSSGHWHH